MRREVELTVVQTMAGTTIWTREDRRPTVLWWSVEASGDDGQTTVTWHSEKPVLAGTKAKMTIEFEEAR